MRTRVHASWSHRSNAQNLKASKKKPVKLELTCLRSGQFPQKNTGLRRTPSKPFCDALLDRSDIEPGPEVATAHLRAPQVHVARAAPRDVPEGRIQFKLPLFFT